MNKETKLVTVNVDGTVYSFTGDEITSPTQQALLMLMQLDKEEREF